MATLTQRLKNAFRPLKRIRKEIGAVRSEIAQMRGEIHSQIAYNVLRGANLAHKNELLMAFYPTCGEKVGVTHDFATMQRYLNATRPVRVSNLVRVGGANDGGYVMINPKIDLLRASNRGANISKSTHDSPPPPRDR